MWWTRRIVWLVVLLVPLGMCGCDDDDDNGEPQPPTVEELLTASLHNTTRGMEYFYETEQGGFEENTGVPYSSLSCKNCHVTPSTCSQCHTTDAPVVGSAEVDDAKCGTCHGRQGAEVAQGFSDVHRTAGMGCADCHSAADVHGDGETHNSMLEPGVILAKCANCHTDLPTNAYHTTHGTNMECSACHVQSVVSCYNCHFESEINEQVKRAYGQFKNWKFLVKRTDTGKIDLANVMTLTYEGKAHVVFAPFYAHTVASAAISSCGDCHGNEAVQEYQSTGEIKVVTWNTNTNSLDHAEGIIPVPPDWETALKFDFVTITAPGTPPTWGQITPTAVGKQMLFAEPLDAMPD
jgi:hypothetical protein